MSVKRFLTTPAPAAAGWNPCETEVNPFATALATRPGSPGKFSKACSHDPNCAIAAETLA
ncbi:Uncharacterised protein [Mycobacterium tuberculosis]|nr:Uncharacterised protein [Mycobacterium tuberculosis]